MSNIKKDALILYGLNNYTTVIDNIIKDLNACKYSFDIKLILTEGLSNAFKHGNNSDSSKPIYLVYSFDGTNLEFKITHAQVKLQNMDIPEDITDKTLLENSGRGLFLIKSFADIVELDGNTLIIKKVLTI